VVDTLNNTDTAFLRRATAWHAFRCCETEVSVLSVVAVDRTLSSLLAGCIGVNGLGDALSGGTGRKDQAMFAVSAACKAVAAMGETAPSMCHLALLMAMGADCPPAMQSVVLAELRRSNAVLSLSFDVASRHLESGTKRAVEKACLGAVAGGTSMSDASQTVSRQAITTLAEEPVPLLDPGASDPIDDGPGTRSVAYNILIAHVHRYVLRLLGQSAQSSGSSVADAIIAIRGAGPELPFAAS